MTPRRYTVTVRMPVRVTVTAHLDADGLTEVTEVHRAHAPTVTAEEVYQDADAVAELTYQLQAAAQDSRNTT